jgi:hypothetical protein
MKTIKPEHLLAITEGEWTRDEDGDWYCEGEPADGVPRWDVLVLPYGLTLCAEWGVYEQRWEDITDPADLARYARAMDAAYEALERSLRESER